MTGIAGTEISRNVQDSSRRKLARLAGFLYLAYIIACAVSTFLSNKPNVSGDDAAMVRNILAFEHIVRIGAMIEIVSALLFLWTAWALYALLKPVSKNLALLFLVTNLAGVAVQCVGTLMRFGALLVLNKSVDVHAFNADQVQALALLFLNWGGSGNMVLTLLYGAWLFPLGYLVFKSGFLPRFLGVLLVLDGMSLMICFVQLCLFPGYEKLTYPLYPIMFIAECGLALWLIVKGVKAQIETSSS